VLEGVHFGILFAGRGARTVGAPAVGAGGVEQLRSKLRRCANRHKISRERVSGRMQGRFANRPYPGLAVVRGESPAYRLYIWVEPVKITKVPVPSPDARGTPPAVMNLDVILSPFASLRVNSAKDPCS
jgi:hypothetical protein